MRKGFRDFLDDLEQAGQLTRLTKQVDPRQLSGLVAQSEKAAFFENTAQRPGPDNRLWRSYRWGRTAEILLLDARTERLPSTRLDDGVYLGDEQLEHVKTRLAESDCAFKIVLNSVPVTTMPPVWPSDDDRWQGYQRQRDELLAVQQLRVTSDSWQTVFAAVAEVGAPVELTVARRGVRPDVRPPARPVRCVGHVAPHAYRIFPSTGTTVVLGIRAVNAMAIVCRCQSDRSFNLWPD